MLQSPTLPDCNQTKTIKPIGMMEPTVFERTEKIANREVSIPTMGLDVISKTSLTAECGTDA